MKSTRHKLTIMALVSFATCVAYVGLYVAVQSVNADIEEAVLLIDEKALEEIRLRSIEETLEDTSGERARLNEYFIQETDIVLLIERLEAFGENSGAAVVISDVDTLATELPEGFETLAVRLTAEGTWRELFHLFSLIDTLPVVLAFEQINLESLPNGGWRGVFNIHIVMKSS
jgi:hypothetical protein